MDKGFLWLNGTKTALACITVQEKKEFGVCCLGKIRDSIQRMTLNNASFVSFLCDLENYMTALRGLENYVSSGEYCLNICKILSLANEGKLSKQMQCAADKDCL